MCLLSTMMTLPQSFILCLQLSATDRILDYLLQIVIIEIKVPVADCLYSTSCWLCFRLLCWLCDSVWCCLTLMICCWLCCHVCCCLRFNVCCWRCWNVCICLRFQCLLFGSVETSAAHVSPSVINCVKSRRLLVFQCQIKSNQTFISIINTIGFYMDYIMK